MSKSAKLMPEANNVPMCVNYVIQSFIDYLRYFSAGFPASQEFSEGPCGQHSADAVVKSVSFSRDVSTTPA